MFPPCYLPGAKHGGGNEDNCVLLQKVHACTATWYRISLYHHQVYFSPVGFLPSSEKHYASWVPILFPSLIWPPDFDVNCARPKAIILQLKHM